jgi:hypothetical protein
MKLKRFNLTKFLPTSDRRAVIWLGVVSLLTHFHWLLDPRVFTSGDWWFISPEKYRDFVSFSPIWVTDGLGGTSATPGFYLIRFFEGLLTTIGSNFAFNEKLFFFLPIIFFSGFGTYIFLRLYFKEWLSFVGAVVFAFNTAILFNYAGALTIAVADALTPFTLYLFRRLLLAPKNNKLLVGTAVTFTFMSAYEFRIALLVMGLAAGLFAYNWLTDEDKRAYLRERVWMITKLGLLLLGLQAFWLLPYLVGARAGVTFSNLLGQSLFVSFSDIQNALTLQHPFWTNARPATFNPQAIPWYAWFIPLAAFAGLLFPRKRIHKELAYWALLSIVGLFLVKQVNEPLDHAYPWLFAHIPGFAAFREASKFYLFIALSYCVLIPYTLASSKQWLQVHLPQKLGRVRMSRVVYGVACLGVLLLFAVNMKPLITGELRTLYVPRHMPSDYATLNSFLDKQPDYFRLMWMPTVSRWAAQTSMHPSLSATNTTQGAWLTQLSEQGLGQGATLRDKASNVFAQNTSHDFLNRASVKYVVVPLRDTNNEDDFFQNYGDDRQYYLNQMDHTSYLQRVNIGTKDVAVYENKQFQPYASASTSLMSLPVSAEPQFNAVQTFANTQLKQQFNFVDQAGLQKMHATLPTEKVIDPFQDLTAHNVQQTGVASHVTNLRSPELYINTASRDVHYIIHKGVITFYGKPRNNLQVDRQLAGPANGKETVLASGKLLPNVRYLVGVGDSLTQVKNRDSDVSLGTQSGTIRLYAETGSNAVTNGSFEQGLWQKTVQDCNAYDDSPALDMHQIDQTSTDGDHALQLESDSHTACTTSAATPVAGGQYLLSFDYRIDGGQNAGYKLTFNDAKKTTLHKDVPATGTWQTYQTPVEVPKGATSFTIQLLGYPDYRFRTHAVTNYDNVQMTPLVRLVNQAAPKPTYTKQAVQPHNGTLDLTYQNTNASQGKNLILNGSFEQGLWKKIVQDCNAYDDNPRLGMELVSRDNGKALELSARRHAACTGRINIPVQQNVAHVLSFDYQSPDASRASYSLQYDDQNHTTVQGSLPIKNAAWQTFTKQVQPPLGAHHVAITVYAYGDDSGTKNIINRYDNFSLAEIPTSVGQYYVVDAAAAATAKPHSITSEKHGATKTTIHVRGATKPFYLSLSESYNPLWRLELNNHSVQALAGRLLPNAPADAVPAKQHVKLNDFQNGWYVDPAALCGSNKAGCTRHADGSYDIELVAEFTPQRWFYVGAGLSAATAVGCAVYVVYKQRRRTAKKVWRSARL